MRDTEFQGKVVLVTGAASGLGRAAALAFVRAGAQVAIADVNAAGLDETVELAGEHSALILSVPTDLADTTACKKLVDRAVQSFGRLDVLCSVAGLIKIEHATAVTPKLWDRIFAVNVRAPFFLIQAALPHLIESGGAIVNVASASAFFGHSYIAPYAASKAALVNLTKSLAMEFINTPVRINAMAPGAMKTPMGASSLPADVDFQLIARYTPLREASEPEEFTDLLLYLASPRSKAVHGACFNIDGGITAG